MAYEAEGPDLSFEAAADLSANQFCAVYLDSNGKAALADADTDLAVGILRNKPSAAGRAANVRVRDVVKAQVSGTIARGAYLIPTGNGTTSGYLIGTTTNGHNYVARAMEAHTADGGTAIKSVLVERGRY